jgi:PPOX class probable F420-dependent enzyme
MSDQELATFLEEQRVMQVCTTGPDGRPHLMPLWYVVEDAPVLRAWTYAASQKVKNLERDPRATLGVDDGVHYEELRGVMFECDVETERDPERVAEYGISIFKRYGDGSELSDEARQMVLKQAEKRVGLRFAPTKTVSWDHRKLGGTY